MLRRHKQVVAFLCLATGLLSFITGRGRSITLDEAVTLSWTYRVFHYNFSGFLNEIHTPSYDIALGLWLSLFGISLACTVIFSAVMSVVSVAAAYTLCRRFFDETVALYCGVLLVLSPLHVYYSQFARTYSFFIAASTLSSLAYLRFRRAPDVKSSLLYLAATFLLITSHLAAFAILAAQWLDFLIFAPREPGKGRLKIWFFVQGGLALLYAPIAWIILRRYDLASDIPRIYSWVPRPGASELLGSFTFLAGSSGLLAALFVALAALALWQSRRASPTPEISYLLLWLLLPMSILFVMSYAFHPVFIQRGFAPSAIPLLILASWGLARVLSPKSLQWFVLACATLCSLAAIGGKWFPQEEGWKALATSLHKSGSGEVQKDLIFIRPAYASLPLVYYLKSECFFSPSYEDCLRRNAIFPIDKIEDIEPHLIAGARAWFVGYNVEEEQNKDLAERLKKLPSLSVLSETKEFASVSLSSFRVHQ